MTRGADRIGVRLHAAVSQIAELAERLAALCNAFDAEMSHGRTGPWQPQFGEARCQAAWLAGCITHALPILHASNNSGQSAPTPAAIEVELPPVRVLPGGRLDRKNAALYLGRSPKTLAQWALHGKGPPSHDIGGRSFYYIADCDAFIAGDLKR